MSNTDYAYAVGRIRVNETKLLTAADYNQLISAQSKDAVLKFITDKGWKPDANGDIENELESAWQLVTECVPVVSLLDSLIIGNDFSNLKACLKAYFSDLEPEKYMQKPCVTDPGAITEAVKHKDFAPLPDHLRICAEEAYNIYVTHQSGQKCETVIDKASLAQRLSGSEKSGSELLKTVVKLQCFEAAIKIALRCSFTGKGSEFALEALPDCPGINKQTLTEKSVSADAVADYISQTEFSEFSDSISLGFTAFEKACDEKIFSLLEKSKTAILSPDPVIAYWIRKTFEVKNVRIILSGKATGIGADEIRSKLRGIDYV